MSPTNSYTYLYLPNECWESVFKFLFNDDDDDNNRHRLLESLSLLSKQFLSITNPLLLSLTFYDPARPYLSRLFHRFTKLTSLDFSFYNGDLDALLTRISRFSLHLTSLNLSNKPNIPADGLRAFSKKIKTLTSLTCSNVHSINSTDLFLIAHSFPLLEELDLSNPINCKNYNGFLDAIKALSLALSKLRKINLSRHCYLNNQSVYHLFKNCMLLGEVILFKCYGVTCDGIAFSLLERPKLWSLSFSNTTFGSARFGTKVTSLFSDSLVSCLNGLTCLDLSSLSISDELLTSIAREVLPLKRLVLQNCTGYNFAGILSLLSKCQSIQYLDLQNAEFMTDHRVAKISLLLGDLVSINLSECRKLTNSALLALVSNCPLLSEIKMEHTSIGKNIAKNSNDLIDFGLNPQLKSLYLAHNSWLRDENLILFASILPNLQLLDLSDCDCISEEGICEVLKRCCKIKHLNLAKCNVVRLLGLNFEVSNLEVLNLSDTNVEDETLYTISKNCCGLLQMILEKCLLVTMNGVKHVVKNCTQLREINLRDCIKVHMHAISVSLMVFSRPSLRKITTPPSFHLNEKKKVNSHQLCIVW
ncbi:hypothetical protein TSUD_258990 [Trifolium subterraneum]|uniref:F-box domain-containing protein n=1 Tax=Trifolium subterraneum TaxID=3900 RepID=A0A2Z6MSS2_TRISU|nr:hypothetical protein TSUD_258990 [Trifolium subterraneum]